MVLLSVRIDVGGGKVVCGWDCPPRGKVSWSKVSIISIWEDWRALGVLSRRIWTSPRREKSNLANFWIRARLLLLLLVEVVLSLVVAPTGPFSADGKLDVLAVRNEERTDDGLELRRGEVGPF